MPPRTLQCHIVKTYSTILHTAVPYCKNLQYHTAHCIAILPKLEVPYCTLHCHTSKTGSTILHTAVPLVINVSNHNAHCSAFSHKRE